MDLIDAADAEEAALADTADVAAVSAATALELLLAFASLAFRVWASFRYLTQQQKGCVCQRPMLGGFLSMVT